MPNKTTVTVEGHTLTLSNLSKVLFPETGFSKRDVVEYYSLAAPALLPHLAGRPITLKRYPDGITDEDFFYQKECPSHRPDWLSTAPIRGGAKTVNYCLLEKTPALIWAANLASLELHASLSRAERMSSPTALVFDLDPGPPAGLLECCRTALRLRDILAHHGLAAFPKTSGSKGLQVYVPLNTPVTYDETKPFAHAVARLMERERPDEVVSKMTKALRRNKVFIDWSQNDEHKTTVCVYSLRAMTRPAVSTPLRWREVETALAKHDPSPLVFEAAAVLGRIKKYGDLFTPVLTLRQKLPVL